MGFVLDGKGETALLERDCVVSCGGRDVSRAAASQAATIRRLIAERTAGQIRDLSVAVEGRGVVLSGRTASFYSKQLAQHAAMPMIGNLPLVNEIEVA
ncbi:MAG: BON domain-containing protein [Pirellulales bacterium]|nr:BON domain-containing protein [Pirellulales bacterium]